MNRFWALAARNWPPSYPTHELIAKIGAENARALVRTGMLYEVAILPHSTVRCPECWRDARVIYERDGNAVAICTGDFQCPDLELGPTPSRSKMNAEDFALRLASALQLDGVPGAVGLVTALGRRRLGDENVAFDLLSVPGRADSFDALARLVRGGPAVRVVLVPDSRCLPADVPGELAGVELVWVGLNEVLTFGEGLGVDLRPILARGRFAVAVVEPPFEGLVVDGLAARWRGRDVAVPGIVAPAVLRALAKRPGAFVGRRELWLELWPEEHNKNGQIPKGVNPDHFEGRLRTAVGELRIALRAAAPTLADAVLTRRGGDAAGAYGLMLPPEHVRLA